MKIVQTPSVFRGLNPKSLAFVQTRNKELYTKVFKSYKERKELAALTKNCKLLYIRPHKISII